MLPTHSLSNLFDSTTTHEPIFGTLEFLTSNMGKDDMFLFWGSGSSPCMRVMIALEEKGFNGYPQKRCDFSKKEHKGPDVMALNPRGQVCTVYK